MIGTRLAGMFGLFVRRFRSQTTCLQPALPLYSLTLGAHQELNDGKMTDELWMISSANVLDFPLSYALLASDWLRERLKCVDPRANSHLYQDVVYHAELSPLARRKNRSWDGWSINPIADSWRLDKSRGRLTLISLTSEQAWNGCWLR